MSDADWFVLTVRPGMERAAGAAVQRTGAEVYLPGELRWVRAQRRKRGAARKVQRPFVSFPGYLFLGMPGWLQAGRGWDAVLDLDLVSAVIMRTVCLDADAARKIWAREPLKLPASWRPNGEKVGGWLEGRIDLMKIAAEIAPPVYEIQPGDEVLVTHDAFDRHPGKLVDIDNGIARVLMVFFGAERTVKAPVDALARARDSVCSG